MKIDRVSYQKTFSIGPYLTDRVGVEISIDDTESPEYALSEAKKIIEQWHEKANPHLYQEASIPFIQDANYTPPQTTITTHPSKEYNLQEEQTEIAIDNATTLEQLEPLKVKCHTVPMFKRYQDKLKQLKDA